MSIFKEILSHYKKRKEFKRRSSLYENKSRRFLSEPPKYKKSKNFPRVKALYFFIFGFLEGFALYSLVFNFKKQWVSIVLLTVLVVFLVGLHIYTRDYKIGLKITFWSGLIASIFIMVVGTYTSTYIQDKPVLVNSTSDKSYKLANNILSDLLTLEDNQKLLNLNFAEGRGVSDLYVQASRQSALISKKWNPAVAKETPLPGFSEVFSRVNKAADIQSQSLALFYSLLQQQDSKSMDRLKSLQSAYMELMYGADGAVNRLKDTVSPLGIKLEVPNER